MRKAEITWIAAAGNCDLIGVDTGIEAHFKGIEKKIGKLKQIGAFHA